ncbi:hypothetical protein [Hymenobacter sp. GOD-10R]|uniref:hypothetical protein n=1 Tax=Hymenobacter sp. GOD-10R TaxID=3093922 RepID=UPI002D77745C|nr:hypothetical protein [Hymenobacter sp. GOD-10R]WRQ31631.1 hypothetical protein SD425_27755 [Hymenobacter sp. GOD-10R]
MSRFLLTVGLLVGSSYSCSTHKREKVDVHSLVGTQWRSTDPDFPAMQLTITAKALTFRSPEEEHPYRILSHQQLLLDHDTVELVLDQAHRLYLEPTSKAVAEAEAIQVIYMYPFEQLE